MTATTQIPGYLAGTWDIDPVHSAVTFSVRHMMVSKVRGRFTGFTGVIRTGAELTDSQVTATVNAASIDTDSEQRDGHVRSADFFAVEARFPHISAVICSPTWGRRRARGVRRPQAR